MKENNPAAKDFERSYVAEIGREQRPDLVAALCSVRQSLSSEFRLARQFNRVATKRAFSFAAALQAIPSAAVGGVEEQTKLEQHLQGMLRRFQGYAGREINKGYMFGKLGRAEWAVADSGNLISQNRVFEQDRKRKLGCRYGITLYPCIRSIIVWRKLWMKRKTNPGLTCTIAIMHAIRLKTMN